MVVAVSPYNFEPERYISQDHNEDLEQKIRHQMSVWCKDFIEVPEQT